MRKVLICGSRTRLDNKFQNSCLEHLIKDDDIVISGMAKGPDTIGRVHAQRRKLEVIKMPANWRLYGRSAGYRRNAEMVAIADRVIAFWDGVSRGTKMTIDLAIKKGLPVSINVGSMKTNEWKHRNF